MRNLKKFLALVLAMMMTLSLMVTVNAAANTNFKDDGEINAKFAEAAEVLTGMGILKGYKAEDGSVSFKPEQKVTRAEMAALVYRLASGDAAEDRAYLYVGGSSFTDVPEGKWYDGVVGYCATYGIIAGVGNNRFNPTGDVTGYQALAMILRAVGYDQNKEFTDNPTWQTNVAQTATVEGLLKNVNTTSYAGKLSQPATRELIAEFLFRGAQIPTVTWTMLGGYNKTDSILGSGKQNPTLGEKGYGLTCHYGIVLGNAATGEDDVTKIGFEINATDAPENPGEINDNGSYKYTDGAASSGTPGNTTLSFDYTTGLEKFGHKVKVWYNADSGAIKETYALSDAAELAVTVSASAATLKTATSGELGKVLNGKGFDIDASSTYSYHVSESFARIGTAKDVANAPTAKSSKVYVAISNNDNKTVDVVIPVDCYATQITQVDNYAKVPSITEALAGTDLKSTDTADGYTAVNGKIRQDEITSPKENNILGGKVIITKITKSTKTDNATNTRFWVDNLTKTEKGTVVSVDKATQEVTLQDGRTLKRSILDNAVIKDSGGDTFNVKDGGDSGGMGKTAGDFAYAEYTFLVDAQGNWLHATREFGTQFVYGTYVDYTTEWGSSTFNYRLVGVDTNGTAVNVDFKKFNGKDMDVTALSAVGDNVSSNVKKVYWHDNTSASAIGQYQSGYMGFAVDGDNNLWSNDGSGDFVNALRPQRLVPAFEHLNANSGELAGTVADTTITKGDVALGVKTISGITKPLYLTEHTKFIVVGGYGTDTQDIKVYNGLTELLDGADEVKIDLDKAGKHYDEMIWASISPYIYASTTVSANQVDTIFLPAGSVIRSNNVNNLYYVKASDATSAPDIIEPGMAAASAAGLYTLYNMGEEVKVWLTNGTTTTADKFYTLSDSGKTTTTGEKIYNLSSALTPGTPGDATDGTAGDHDKIVTDASSSATFKGTTNNGLTALITISGGKTYAVNTANVVVKSLTDKTTASNINELNDLASVWGTIAVSLQYAEKGSNVVTCIYVTNVS